MKLSRFFQVLGKPAALATTGLVTLLIVAMPVSAHAGPLRPLINLVGHVVGAVRWLIGF